MLMDRAVLNDSNLTNANLSRAILTRRVCLPCQTFCTKLLSTLCLLQPCQIKWTLRGNSSYLLPCAIILMHGLCCRSDLGGAKISGTDFTNALVDKTQQIVRRSLLHAVCGDSILRMPYMKADVRQQRVGCGSWMPSQPEPGTL